MPEALTTPADESATILVVDDDAVMRLMASEALRESGYRVIEATSAEEGLALFADTPVDLVLLDVILPGMNGYEACARIREMPAGASIPIVVTTGRDDRESIVEAYASGATDFVTKPIIWDLLPYRIRYALRANRSLRETARSQALLARSQHMANMGSWEWVRATDSLQCSDEFHRIHGTEPGSCGGMLTALLRQVHPEDVERVAEAIGHARDDGRPYRLEMRIIRSDGGQRRLMEQTDVERDAAGVVVAVHGIRHDITQQVEADQRIRTLAYFDPLTGLANRTLLVEMVRRGLPRAGRQGHSCALLLVDLDRFKLINESFGPRVGDDVLKVVGDRLRDAARTSDAPRTTRGDAGDDRAERAERLERAERVERVARLGSDEFAIVLVDTDNSDDVLRLAQRVALEVAEPITVDGHALTVTSSIGIAIAPFDGADVDSLLRNATTAMHAAKEGGRHQIRFYNEAMSAGVRRRLMIETELRRAIDNDELCMHYQAKVDARTARVVGAVAPVRWQHPQRGLLGPAEFIEVAEESGLIVPMTMWIIDRVCEQVAHWARQGLPPVAVSINLASASLQDDSLIATVVRALERSGVPPRQIEFEVTESSLLRDVNQAARLLEQLKRLGLKLAIDDFGTGYSSLTYLKRLAVDVLKIDRSFIMDLTVDPNDAAIIAAIIAMGSSLGLELVAEGVESWEQADILIRRGCPIVQGFLFARPLPSAAFAQLLRVGLPERAEPPVAG